MSLHLQEELTSDLKSLVRGIDALNETMRSGFTTLSGQLTHLSQDVKGLSQDVKGLSHKVENGFDKLSHQVKGLSGEVSGARVDILQQLRVNGEDNRVLHQQLSTLVRGRASSDSSRHGHRPRSRLLPVPHHRVPLERAALMPPSTSQSSQHDSGTELPFYHNLHLHLLQGASREPPTDIAGWLDRARISSIHVEWPVASHSSLFLVQVHPQRTDGATCHSLPSASSRQSTSTLVHSQRTATLLSKWFTLVSEGLSPFTNTHQSIWLSEQPSSSMARGRHVLHLTATSLRLEEWADAALLAAQDTLAATPINGAETVVRVLVTPNSARTPSRFIVAGDVESIPGDRVKVTFKVDTTVSDSAPYREWLTTCSESGSGHGSQDGDEGDEATSEADDSAPKDDDPPSGAILTEKQLEHQAVMQPQGSTLHEAVSDWMDGGVMVPHHVDHGPRRDTPDGMPEGAHEVRYPHSGPPSSVTKSLPDDTTCDVTQSGLDTFVSLLTSNGGDGEVEDGRNYS